MDFRKRAHKKAPSYSRTGHLFSRLIISAVQTFRRIVKIRLQNRLAWWPDHFSFTKKMDVQVLHRLLTILTGVDYYTVTVIQAF